jgi:hypothetical protein
MSHLHGTLRNTVQSGGEFANSSALADANNTPIFNPRASGSWEDSR